MNFDERKQIATELVVDFLGDFSPPRGLDDSQMAKRIVKVADAFARRMPTDGDYREKVGKVLTRVSDTHLSNSWPAQAAFVMAMPEMEYRGAAPRTFQADKDSSVPRLMSQGLPVAESEVWKNHDVSREVIDRYRFAAVQKWLEVHKTDAQRFMMAKYGAIVCPYFMDEKVSGV